MLKYFLSVLIFGVVLTGFANGKSEAELNDDAFLDLVQRECYHFFKAKASPETGFVPDRLDADFASTAGIGFQLATLVIADQRGYESKDVVRERVMKIMRTLKKVQAKYGFYFHYLDMKTGEPSKKGYETVLSSIDATLLMCGVIAVAEHFGGEVQTIADEIYMKMEWQPFILKDRPLISMAWKPDSKLNLQGEGSFSKWCWDHYTDESVLCTLLGISSPRGDALSGDYFYRWKRPYNIYKPLNKNNKAPGRFVTSWDGALFTYQFAHLFIDFSKLGRDMPAKHGLKDVPSVDWHENTRIASLTARLYCLERADSYRSYTEGWGPTASSTTKGYSVDGFLPCPKGDQRKNKGSIAPYAAASSITLTPKESIAALRHYYRLTTRGECAIWQPVAQGGYGFWDSMDAERKGVARQIIAIDQGPLVIAIENYRSGLIQKLVMRNQHIQRGLQKVGFEKLNPSKTEKSGIDLQKR